MCQASCKGPFCPADAYTDLAGNTGSASIDSVVSTSTGTATTESSSSSASSGAASLGNGAIIGIAIGGFFFLVLLILLFLVVSCSVVSDAIAAASHILVNCGSLSEWHISLVHAKGGCSVLAALANFALAGGESSVAGAEIFREGRCERSAFCLLSLVMSQGCVLWLHACCCGGGP